MQQVGKTAKTLDSILTFVMYHVQWLHQTAVTTYLCIANMLQNIAGNS